MYAYLATVYLKYAYLATILSYVCLPGNDFILGVLTCVVLLYLMCAYLQIVLLYVYIVAWYCGILGMLTCMVFCYLKYFLPCIVVFLDSGNCCALLR